MRNNQGRHLKKPTSTLLQSHADTKSHDTDVLGHDHTTKIRGVDVIDTSEQTDTHGEDVLGEDRDAETRSIDAIDNGTREAR